MNCYRFTSKSQFRTLAAQQNLIGENNSLITGGHGWAVDEIGIITKGGTYDTNGEVLTPPVPQPGWHVNTIGLAPEAWDAHRVVVNTPARVFLQR
jgi:hypothetical protein